MRLAVYRFIVNDEEKFVFPFLNESGNIERKGRMSANMHPHAHAVQIHHRFIIHRAKIKQRTFLLFRIGEFLFIITISDKIRIANPRQYTFGGIRYTNGLPSYVIVRKQPSVV